MKSFWKLTPGMRHYQFALALLAILPLPAQAQNPDTLSGAFNNSVQAVAAQSDGSLLIGGSFTGLRNGLTRLNPDNLTDNAFNPGLNNLINVSVHSINIQPDGGILLGGAFTNMGSVPRSRLARLTPDGLADITFNPGANTNVYALATQPDGKILVAGGFTNLAGQARSYLGRLNPDGSLDESFLPMVDGPVHALLIQTDGKILLGGDFTTIDSVPRERLARLDADGFLDQDFTPGADGSVFCLALQADDKIIVGGNFTTLAGQARFRMARLEIGGALDNSFAPEFSGEVRSLALQADGRIFAGGDFTNVSGLVRSNLVRLEATGAVDNYIPNPNAAVLGLGLQADGKLLVGGNFTGIGVSFRNRLARLTNDIPATQSLTYAGAALTWLRSGSSPEVYRVTFSFSTDGTNWVELPAPTRIAGGWRSSGILIPAPGTFRARGEVRGGYNNSSTWFIESSTGPIAISSQPADQIALFNMPARFTVTPAGDGPFFYRWYRTNVLVYASQHPSYTAPPNPAPGITQFEVLVSNTVSSIRSPAATLWTPGADAWNPYFSVSINTVLSQRDGSVIAGGANIVSRFNPNGLVDITFTPAVNGSVLCLAAQDENLLIAGSFTTVAGFSRNRLARLDAFGGVDASFNPNVNGTINALVMLGDGQILIGGSFTSVGGIPHTNLARLNPDGTPDSGFIPAANGIVHSLAVQPDGMILVGGTFTQMNGVARGRLARLQSDGSLDAGLNPASSGNAIYSIVVQPDEKILVGGEFYSLGGQFRNGLGRLNADGTVDSAFNANVNLPSGRVVTIQLQTDRRIWIGGSFSFGGQQSRSCLARLNPDGSLDPTIGPNSSSSSIYGLALQSDGKLLACGSFGSLYSANRSRLGRVLNSTAATQSLTTDGSSVTWQRSGSTPEIDRATFAFCTNGTDWIELPEPARISGGWQTTGIAIPLNATLRARGYANGGSNNGSTYCTEVSSGPPVVAIGPTDLRGTYRNSERLTVTTYGDGPFTFQWYFRGLLLSHETNSWLNASGNPNAFVYEVEVTSPAGTIRSQPLTYWASGPDGFDPDADGTVRAIAVQADQKILLGGDFTNSPGNRLARVWSNGARDLEFTPTVLGGGVYGLAIQTNGQILVGGGFTNLNGVNRRGLARLNRDGSLDASFNPSVSGSPGVVQCLAVQPDGRILVGGYFQFLNGQSRYCLGRLKSDGSLDGSFVPPAGHGPGFYIGVTSLLLEADGNLLVFGEMTEVDRTTYAQRLDAFGNRMFRIFYWGPFLPGPSPGPSPRPFAHIACATRQPEGSIVMGGLFDWVENNQWHRNLARIDATGFLDSSFTNGADAAVTALAAQADGKILVGGDFTALAGQSRNGLGRLNADGSLDSAYNLQPSGSAWIRSLAIQPDGRLLVGGSFTDLVDRQRDNVGRLVGPEIATEELSLNGMEVNWQRSGASPEVGPTILETSTDGVNWSYQGDGVRTPEGWQWFGVTPPSNAVLRARGFVGGGSSFWHAESILPTSPRSEPNLLTTPGCLSLGATGFGFSVTGNLGHLAIIEASTNLTQWTAIQTNRLLPPPTFFNDTSATNLPRRFYRARLQ